MLNLVDLLNDKPMTIHNNDTFLKALIITNEVKIFNLGPIMIAIEQ